MTSQTKGVVAAVGAFVFWGLTPIYWSTLRDVPALESILHRIWWAFPLLWTIVLLRRYLAVRKDRSRTSDASARAQVHDSTGTRGFPYPPPATAQKLFPSFPVFARAALAGVLVVANWLTYVYAVTNGHTLDASLGYYLNPLVSVALGTIVLRERLSRLQAAAVGIAVCGAIYLTVRLGSLPWISLVLAVSFGVYGLIKKRIPVGSIHSLALELVLLAPIAFITIAAGVARGSSALVGVSAATTLLLIAAGAVTVIPLILFGYAAQHIRLSDVGFVQYIAPTLMLFVGIFVFDEVLDTARLPGFIMVWIALVLYSISTWAKVDATKA